MLARVLPEQDTSWQVSEYTQALDDEELLLELLLLQLCTAGAAANEACGAIVRSAAGAPGNLYTKAPNAKASSISTKTTSIP